MTGYENSNTFDVNDPGFSRTTYASNTVVGIRVYGAVKMTLLEEIMSGETV